MFQAEKTGEINTLLQHVPRVAGVSPEGGLYD